MVKQTKNCEVKWRLSRQSLLPIFQYFKEKRLLTFICVQVLALPRALAVQPQQNAGQVFYFFSKLTKDFIQRINSI